MTETLIELELFKVPMSLFVVELLQPAGTVKLLKPLNSTDIRFLLRRLPLNCESSILDRESVSEIKEGVIRFSGLVLPKPAIAPKTEHASPGFN